MTADDVGRGRPWWCEPTTTDLAPSAGQPPTGRLTGDEYVDLLVERRDAWQADNPPDPRCPSWIRPLLEWFVLDGDDEIVDLPPEPQTRRPRLTDEERAERQETRRQRAAQRLAAAEARLVRAEQQWAARSGTEPLDHGVLSGIRRRSTPRQARQHAASIDRTVDAAVQLDTARTAVQTCRARLASLGGPT